MWLCGLGCLPSNQKVVGSILLKGELFKSRNLFNFNIIINLKNTSFLANKWRSITYNFNQNLSYSLLLYALLIYSLIHCQDERLRDHILKNFLKQDFLYKGIGGLLMSIDGTTCFRLKCILKIAQNMEILQLKMPVFFMKNRKLSL